MTEQTSNIIKELPKDEILNAIWDAFLVAEHQSEQWHDCDTCQLIYDKLVGDEPIEFDHKFIERGMRCIT